MNIFPSYLLDQNLNPLAQRELQNASYLLNSNGNSPEVSRRAAEQSLFGGGFSGNRQNRLQESEAIARMQLGSQLLAPYLQRAETARLEEQRALQQNARDIAQREHELVLLQRRADNETGLEKLRIQGAADRLATEIARDKEKQQLDIQAAFERQAVEQQGLNTRQQTGIQGELDKLRFNQNWESRESALDRASEAALAAAKASAVQSSQGQRNQSGGQSASMQSTRSILNGLGSGGGMGGGVGFMPPVNNQATFRGASLPYQNQTSDFGPYSGGYQYPSQTNNAFGSGPQQNFVDATEPYSYDWTGGLFEGQTQSYAPQLPGYVDNTGDFSSTINWDSIDNQLNNSGNWVDAPANYDYYGSVA